MAKRGKNGTKYHKPQGRRGSSSGTVQVRPGTPKCPKCGRTIFNPVSQPSGCKGCHVRFVWEY